MMLFSRSLGRKVTCEVGRAGAALTKFKFSVVRDTPPSLLYIAGPYNYFKTATFSTTRQTLKDRTTMDAQELTHFLADSPPSAVRLEIKPHFEALSEQQKRYAHYISRYVPTNH